MSSYQSGNRMNDPKSNPCIVEQKASFKCLEKNNYNRDACQQYFDVYKDCKKRMIQAKRHGVPMVKPDTSTSSELLNVDNSTAPSSLNSAPPL